MSVHFEKWNLKDIGTVGIHVIVSQLNESFETYETNRVRQIIKIMTQRQ